MFLSSFFAGGRKKQNKFPSNLQCPVKKLNPVYFQLNAIVSDWLFVFLHLLPTEKWFSLFVRCSYTFLNISAAIRIFKPLSHCIG